LEVFAQYALRLTNTDAAQTEWHHAFELTRAHASLEGAYQTLRARFVLEAVRSSSEGALLGVAGDSLVIRVREASAAWQPIAALTFHAGVVPTLTIPELEGTWRLRAVSPVPLEQTGMMSPADLGVTARWSLPGGYGIIGAGYFNGDGYTQRELNRGKNIEVMASIHPAPGGYARPLAVMISYINGSTGTGLSRADRLTAAVLWQGMRLRAGATFTYAFGLEDDGAREGWLAEGFARWEPISRLVLGARVSFWQRGAEETDRLTTILGTGGWRLTDFAEFYLAASRSIPGARAVQALPASDHWELRAVTRAVF
jgi:hypothetical protein